MPSLDTKGNRFYPSLPEITADSVSHTNALQQIKTALRTYQREDSNYLKSFVRFEELIELGLIDVDGTAIEGASDGLSGIDLTGGEQGDLLFNVDGISWQPTGSNLRWKETYLSLGNDISISWDSASAGDIELLNFSDLPSTPAIPASWGSPDNFTETAETVENVIIAQAFSYAADGSRALICASTSNDAGLYVTAPFATPYLPDGGTAVKCWEGVDTYAYKGAVFSSDGTKVFIIEQLDTVSEVIIELNNTGTPFAPGAGELTPSGNEYDWSADHANLWGLWLNADGTELYSIADGANLNGSETRIIKISLPTANSLVGATEAQQSINLQSTSVNTSPQDLTISPDGLTLYYLSGFTNGTVHYLTMTSPFDLSTLSYTSGNDFVPSMSTGPRLVGIDCSPNGDIMSVQGYFSFSLTNTKTLVHTSSAGTPGIPGIIGETAFTVGDPDYPTLIDGSAITFHDAYTFPTADGTANQSLVTDGAGNLSFASVGTGAIDESDLVHITGFEYILGNKQFNASPFMNSPLVMLNSYPIQWAGDTDVVSLLDFSGLPGTPEVPTVWAAIDTFTQVSSSEFLMTETFAFKFNDDGTRGYGVSASSGNGFRRSGVYSVPYTPEDTADPPELVFNGQFSCFAWGDAGTKVYLANNTGGLINEYANSGTAYNPASGDLTFTDSFNPTAIGTAICITWKPDGTKVWLGSGGFIYGYDVPTAWDLSSASTTETDSYNFNSDRVGNIEDWLIDPSGTVVYVLQAGFVYEYSLSTAWDTTTHSYESRSINGATGTAGGGVRGLDLSPDGATLIVQSQWGNNRFNNDTMRWTSAGSTPGTPATEGDTVFTVGDPAYPTEIDGTKVGFKGSVGLNWDNSTGDDVELAVFLSGVSWSGWPASVGEDALYNNVELLLNFNEVDGSTTTIDESTNAFTVTLNNGAILDDQQAFSESTSLDNRTADANASIPNNAALQVAAQDFCIEGFYYFDAATRNDTTAANTHRGAFASKWTDAGTREWVFGWRYDFGSGHNLIFTYSTNGTNGINLDFGTYVPVNGEFTHFAITRSGNDFRCFVNGVQFGTTLTAAVTLASTTSPIYVGAYVQNGVDVYEEFPGWIDSFRMTVGNARYTTNFTPPSLTVGETFNLGDPLYKTVIDGTEVNITGDGVVDGTLNVSGDTAFASDITVGQKFNASVTTVITTSHTAGDEHVVLVDDDTAAAAVTVTLPLAATANTLYHVKKLGTTAEVIIDGNGSETIDDRLTITLNAQYESVMLISDGTSWSIL